MMTDEERVVVEQGVLVERCYDAVQVEVEVEVEVEEQ